MFPGFLRNEAVNDRGIEVAKDRTWTAGTKARDVIDGVRPGYLRNGKTDHDTTLPGRTEAKVEPQSRSGAKAESGLNGGDPLYLFVCLFIRDIFGMAAQIMIRLLLGGSESSVTGIEVENETEIEIDIDRYKRKKIHFTSMPVQLRPLTIRANRLQESAEQRLPGRLVF
ncbi:hypothetical protein EVAR_16058_1 [Eumeta japonica]|uniref:Uncharacterized protein n=1 Tax=Eumeta variegata TaxID=151549 RepID=A0A4C1VXF7_EUMVA|nr:hypothetical protein EVAR_16058_1 [Eumeta japonica]